MVTKELRDKAFLFFKDSKLTYDWLYTPCRSFGGITPSEHYSSSIQGQKDVIQYLDTLLND